MRRMLILFLVLALGLVGATFFFVHKADSSAPEPSLIREEALNVGPY